MQLLRRLSGNLSISSLHTVRATSTGQSFNSCLVSIRSVTWRRSFSVTRQFVDVHLALYCIRIRSFLIAEHCELHHGLPRPIQPQSARTDAGSKLATTIATTFSVEYASQWSQFFPDTPLTRPFPTFDGRTVLYPKRKILRDYLSWRQADCMHG